MDGLAGLTFVSVTNGFSFNQQIDLDKLKTSLSEKCLSESFTIEAQTGGKKKKKQ